MRQNRQRGFTLTEIVIAVGVILLIGAVIVPLILSHMQDSRVASVSDNRLKIQAATRSAVLDQQGELKDTDNDGDYLDELIRLGYLDRRPSLMGEEPQNVILKEAPSGDGIQYYLKLDCNSTECQQLIKDVDRTIDGEVNGTSGQVWWDQN